MAKDQITKEDLIGKIKLDAEVKAIRELINAVEDLDKQYKEIAKFNLDEVTKIDPATLKGQKELNKLQEETNKLEEKQNDLDKEAVKLKKQLSEAEDEQVKARLKFQKATREQKKALADEIVLNDKNAGTLEKLVAQNRKLRREREKLNLDTEEGQKRLKEINKELDNNNEVIKENSDLLKKQRLNVGNYTESIQEATGELGGLIGNLKKSVDQGREQIKTFIQMGKAAKTTSDRVKLIGKAFKAAGLGLIIGVLGAVTKSFGDTREGAAFFEDTMEKVSNTLSAISNKIRSKIENLVLGFQVMQLELQKAFTFDDKKEKALEDTIDGLNKKIKENNDAQKDLFETIGKSFDATNKYRKELLLLEDQRAKDAQSIAELQGQEELLDQQVGDMTISFNKQREAQDNLNDTVRERISLEKDLAGKDVGLAALKIQQQLIKAQKDYSIEQIKNLEFLDDEDARMKISSENLEALRDAKTALIEKDNELNTILQKNALERRNTEKDDFEKQLDYAIDAFDVNKTINERIINDERTTLSERDRLTEETVRLADKAFKNQISLVQDYTKQRIDFDKLVALQDEESIRRELAKNDLNETTLTRILEIIKERKIALQDLSDIETETANKRIELNNTILESEQSIEQDNFDLSIELMQREFDKQVDLGKESIQELKDRLEEEKKLRIQQLTDQAQFEKEALDREIMEEEERAQKKKEIESKLQNDIERLNQDTADKKEELDKKEFERKRELQEQYKDEVFEFINDALDKREDQLNQELEDSKSQEDSLRDLANQRVLFADESLAVEKAKQAEIQKELAKNEARRQLVKATESALELLGAYAEGGSKTPFKDAFSDITKMLTALKNIKFFNEGTESVAGIDKGYDSVPAMLRPKERVVPVEDNKMIGNISNKKLAEIAYNYRTGKLNEPLKTIKIETQRFETNEQLISKVEAVEKAIKNIPKVDIRYNDLAHTIAETIIRSNDIQRRHFKIDQILK